MISTLDVVKHLGDTVLRTQNMRPLLLTGVGALSTATDGELAFCSGTGSHAVQAINRSNAGAVLCTVEHLAGDACRGKAIYLAVAKPRLAFVQVYERFFASSRTPTVHPTVIVGRDCQIDESASIGAYVTIGDQVSIGRGTRIGPGVVIGDRVQIGRDCDIHANAVIGEAGFGFERDETGRAIPFPHLGRVVIGDRVLVGADTCIARGALSDTIIEDDVQIDSHVHIAHNVRVQRAVTIVAHCSISGSVVIEEGAWLSPGSIVIGGTTVGAGATVGVGSVVTKSVKPQITVFGNPARTVWADSQ